MVRTQVNGVTLVATAAIIAVMGAYAISSFDSADVAVVSYQELEDVTDLFSFSDEPQFLDYNSSKNYTGYYTDESTHYWDGVKYKTAGRANNYRLDLAPISKVTSTDVAVGTTSSFVSDGLVNVLDGTLRKACRAYHDTLDHVLSYLSIASNYDLVVLTSPSDYDVDLSSTYPDWVVFAPSSYIINPGATSETVSLIQYGSGITPSQVSYANYYAPIAVQVNMEDGTVSFYADNSCQIFLASGVTSETNVYWGYSSGTYAEQLATTFDIEYIESAETEYLDPAEGVKVDA